MMIRLSDGCYVAADQVAEVTLNDARTRISVRMKDGVGHHFEPNYGESLYQALDRLIGQINTAASELP